jgi:hypothetical protein
MTYNSRLEAKVWSPPELTDLASHSPNGTDSQGPVRRRFLRHQTLNSRPWKSPPGGAMDKSKLRQS